ncbi:MAG: hypothetical protein RLZ97_1472 [Verrucomicrobiota bacterium]|jgi:hypothetical protein
MARRRHKTSPDELDLFDQETRKLEEQIAELARLPEQVEQEKKERDSTIPPPDHLAELERRRRFDEQAARGEVRNERRAQGKSLVLMLLLLTATLAVLSWIVRLASA